MGNIKGLRKFEYKQNGGSGTNWNPMLPEFTVELGKDGDGRNWLCKVRPVNMMTHLMWAVDFDTDDERIVDRNPNWLCDEEDEYEMGKIRSTPFLRPEVLYGRGDWSFLMREYHHRKVVEYIDINRTVNEFVKEMGIR